MSWNAGQLGILRELGHEPMLLATAFGAGPVGAASAANDLPQQPKAIAAKAAPTNAKLADAVARAAAGGDLSALALDLERLRREPALKRALWPQLRALRRGR